MTHYAEAIKRNPDDPKGYSNRCAALTKLMALPEALKDADKAIEVDPTFGAHRSGPCPAATMLTFSTLRSQSRATSDEPAFSSP